MWYKFIECEQKGRLRVKHVQTCWYEDGDCFDEAWTIPEENDADTLKKIGMFLPYVGAGSSRVFVHMDDGEVYELLMNKLTEEQFRECNNFNGGRQNRILSFLQ